MNRTLKYFCIVLLSFTAPSCSSEQEAVEIPPSVITPDSMVQLLADLHIAESKLLLSGTTPTAVLPKSAYIKLVLLTNGADTTRFSNSFDFYIEHPELFADVYGKVITEISERQAKNQ